MIQQFPQTYSNHHGYMLLLGCPLPTSALGHFKFSLIYNLDFSKFFCLIIHLIDKICGLKAFE